MLTVYAFFTSCLNLVLQNDREAHKLQLLQPLIEKHITELKLDQLSLQNSCDIFEATDQTLSSIGGPSFNTSYNSPNNTFLKQSQSTTPQRQSSSNPLNAKPTGLSISTKHNYLKTLLQISN